jgi:hypothetical protein
MDTDEKQPAARVRFGDQRTDEEAGEHVGAYAPRHHRRLSRQSSVGSLSIHSAGGGTRTVQPETALPITYRTLSIEIDEGQQQKQQHVKKAKDKAAVGQFFPPTIHNRWPRYVFFSSFHPSTVAYSVPQDSVTRTAQLVLTYINRLGRSGMAQPRDR